MMWASGSTHDAWDRMLADAFDEEERSFVALAICIYNEVRVCLDAAYNHPQGRTLIGPRIHTIAAYIADVDDWRKLCKEWRKELVESNVPYFHMKDFEHARNVATYGRGQLSSKSPYHGWSLGKLNLFESRLHNIINRMRPDGPMFFNEPRSFEEILSVVEKFEREFNSLARYWRESPKSHNQTPERRWVQMASRVDRGNVPFQLLRRLEFSS